MIEFTHGPRVFRVRMDHADYAAEHHAGKSVRRQTTATVEWRLIESAEWEPCNVFLARVNHRDSFDRHKGLRICMSRLFAVYKIPRDLRRTIWDQVWNGKYSDDTPLAKRRQEQLAAVQLQKDRVEYNRLKKLFSQKDGSDDAG